MSDTDIPYFCIVQYQTTHKHNEKKNIQTGIIPQVSKIEVTVMGSTMHLCGLTDGDIVYVSPNISPTPGDIIFVHTNGKPSLQVYSPDTADIPDIIGVVCGVFIPERPLKAEYFHIQPSSDTSRHREILSELEDIFTTPHDAENFLAQALSLPDVGVIRLLNNYRARGKVCKTTPKTHLHEILHKYGIYKASRQNFAKQIK